MLKRIVQNLRNFSLCFRYIGNGPYHKRISITYKLDNSKLRINEPETPEGKFEYELEWMKILIDKDM